MGLLDDIRGLLTPKPAVVPNPFDRQANAAIPIMGASEILPNMVGRMTGSPMAEFAAGFLSPSSWMKQPKKLDIFVGKGAKTWDADKAAKAADMEKAGVDRATIWKETGTWKGPDKQWRQEIPDNAAKQLKNAKNTGMHYLDQWISHPELQAAYPNMFNHEFAGIAGDGGILAMAKQGYGHGGSFLQNNLVVDGATKGAERKSITLHELQHAIQQREGFARGGSPEAMRSFLAPDPSLQSAYSQAELNDAYRRLAGEAEARLTQSRMPMTMDERLATPPWTMYDVPEAQQIVRFGDGPAMAINPADYGLPINPDGTVSLLHGTTKDAASKIIREGKLRSAGEPSVYLTNARDAGYGDGTLVQVDVDPRRLFIDDEFPSGRYDFSMPTRGGVANVSNARIPRPRNHLGQEIPPTPYELAHAEAQRVAALPVEQGGLGLPEGNTAMDRARAMGHVPKEFYHATSSDVPKFDLSYAGQGTTISPLEKAAFLSDKPSVANEFVAGPYYKSGDEIARHYGEGSNIMPLSVRSDAPEVWDMYGGGYTSEFMEKTLKRAKKGGKDVVRFSNMKDPGFTTLGSGEVSNILAVLEPKNIRSRFAAFNPAKRDSADLLAGIAPWALPVGTTLLGGSFLLPPEEY